MSDTTAKQPASPAVLSLAQLLEQQPSASPACLVEPGLLPPQGILFVGGEPKVGKSLLVANLALSLAAGADRSGNAGRPFGMGHHLVAGSMRDLEFLIAKAVWLLAVGGQEVGETRAHVSCEMLDQNRNRIRFLVKSHEEILVRKLPHGSLGHALVPAELALGFFEIELYRDYFLHQSCP